MLLTLTATAILKCSGHSVIWILRNCCHGRLSSPEIFLNGWRICAQYFAQSKLKSQISHWRSSIDSIRLIHLKKRNMLTFTQPSAHLSVLRTLFKPVFSPLRSARQGPWHTRYISDCLPDLIVAWYEYTKSLIHQLLRLAPWVERNSQKRIASHFSLWTGPVRSKICLKLVCPRWL